MAELKTPWTRWTHTRDNAGAAVLENSRYIVHIYPPVRQAEGWPRVIHLSIRNIRNTAVSDFRDFQRIKTELIHPEAEAIQIFPAESRLVDSCNQYHLFVMAPDDLKDGPFPTIPIGYLYGRDVVEHPPDGCEQRPFGEGSSTPGGFRAETLADLDRMTKQEDR